MSIWGLLIGGAAGLALSGPIGGLVGAAAGLIVGRGIAAATADPEQLRQMAFTAALIALAAKMAKADGTVTRDEIAAFRERFEIPPESVEDVGRFWNLARETSDGYEAYAEQLAEMFGQRHPALEQLLDLLVYIARADAEISKPEEEYLATVAQIFGFDEEQFRCILDGEDDPWTVLGVDRDISDEDLKKRRNELVKKYHPDTLHKEGLPEELLEAAEEKVAQINAAYDKILEIRGRKPRLS